MTFFSFPIHRFYSLTPNPWSRSNDYYNNQIKRKSLLDWDLRRQFHAQLFRKLKEPERFSDDCVWRWWKRTFKSPHVLSTVLHSTHRPSLVVRFVCTCLHRHRTNNEGERELNGTYVETFCVFGTPICLICTFDGANPHQWTDCWIVNIVTTSRNTCAS